MVRLVKFDPGRRHHEILQPTAEDGSAPPPRYAFDHMLRVMERAGRTCHGSEGSSDGTVKGAERFVRKMLRLGHYSVVEHGLMTVRFFDVSRGFTHSVVRNRLCTFSQQSTVHSLECDKNMRVVVPPDVESDAFEIRFEAAEREYRALRMEYNTVQARYVLPIGVCNDIVVSANMRQWRHVFIMRTKRGEDWENLKVVGALLRDAREACPALFGDFEEDGRDDHGIPYYKEEYGA